MSFVGLGIGFYPYIVPGALTIQEAAAPESSLIFRQRTYTVILPYTGLAAMALAEFLRNPSESPRSRTA